MKRSEMLNKIKEKLQNNIVEIDYAEQILKTVEELGMLPPSIPTNATGWEVGQGAPTHINEWEDEATVDHLTDKEYRNRYGDKV